MKFSQNIIMTSSPRLLVNVIEPLVQTHTLTDIEILGDCAVFAQAEWKWPNLPKMRFHGQVVIDAWTGELSLASRTYWKDGKEISHEEISLDKYIHDPQDANISEILDMALGKIWER